MGSTGDVRWRQRFSNFEKALGRLRTGCDLDTYSELEQAGLVQTFEFTFELCWKTLKDLLNYGGYDAKSPRDVIRTAFKAGYISEGDAEAMLGALETRNQLTHTYSEAAASQAVELIKELYAPFLDRIHSMLREKL